MNLREMFGLRVPVISVVIGEGGSGGALAIGCANWNLIMEHSVYYVASPEACAAILWKSRAKAGAVRPPRLLMSCRGRSSGGFTESLTLHACATARLDQRPCGRVLPASCGWWVVARCSSVATARQGRHSATSLVTIVWGCEC